MIKSLRRRMPAIILLSLMVSSMILSLNIANSSSLFTEIDTNNLASSSSTNSVSQFYINGTQIYEDGTWYLYQNESMELKINATSDVSEAYFWYQFSTGGIEYNDTMSAGSDPFDFDEEYYFDGNVQTGLYDAKIILKDGTGQLQNFSFSFHIDNPDPVIYAVYVKDLLWNNEWTRIYENQLWTTYRQTTLEIVAQVGNTDDLDSIQSVTLEFENGESDIWVSVEMSEGSKGTFNGNPITNYTSSDLNTSIDAGSKKNLWEPGEYYEVNINATDAESNEWNFPFNIEIRNKAPQITDFTISGDDIETPSVNGDLVTITVNASDLEDNIINDPTDTAEIVKFNSVRSYGIEEEGTNIDWISESPDVSDLYNEDTYYHYVTMSPGSYYYNNISISNWNPEHISKWGFNFTYWTNESSNVELFMLNQSANSGAGEWVDTGANLVGSATPLSWENEVVEFDMSSYDLTDFCNENSSNTVKIRFNATNAANFSLDMMKVVYFTEQRYSLHNIYLKIYNPLDLDPQTIDLFEFWNSATAPGNQWSYEYNLSSKINGAYSFVIEIYDWGEIIPQNVNDILYMRSYDEMLQTRAYSTLSHVVNYGVARSEINEVTGEGLEIINRESVDPNSDLSITLNVTDTTNAYNADKYANFSISSNDIYTQNGSIYYTTDTNNFSKVSNENIYGETSSVNTNSLDSLNFTMETAKDQSLIFTYYLDDYFWLNAVNITGLKPVWNWWFEDADDNIDQIGISFWNWSESDWTSSTYNSTNEEFNPIPLDKNQTGHEYSIDWIEDSSEILDIVNSSLRNCIVVRFEIIGKSSFASNYNISVAYQTMEVKYDNYFQAYMELVDSKGSHTIYTMEDTFHSTESKLWEVSIPVDEVSPRDYSIMLIILQDGNSTVKILSGRFEQYDAGAGYQLFPQLAFNEESWYDRNMTFSVRRRNLESSFESGNSYIVRNSDYLQFNGTLSGEAKIPAFDYDSFSIEFRPEGSTTLDDWETYSLSRPNLDYDESTGFWNLSRKFDSTFTCGKYQYRLSLLSSDGEVLTSNWYGFELLNYQPYISDISILDISEPFYRESTELDVEFQIRDLDSNINDLDFEVVLPCNERSDPNNPIVWTEEITSPTIVSNGNGYYTITGSTLFDKEINAEVYSNIYIRVLDNDASCAQKGTERIAGSIDIRNSLPVIVVDLSSNATNDMVYRNNDYKLNWTIFDADDLIDEFSFPTFSVTNPDSSVTSLNTGDLTTATLTEQFYYEIVDTTDISDEFGIYSYNIIMEDRDGAQVTLNYDLTVQNNLPYVTEIKIENLDFGHYSTMVADENISDFWMFRNDNDMKVTVNLTDVEDSYQGDFSIQDVSLSLEHVYANAQVGDPWEDSDDWDSTFTKVKSASENGNGIETWEVTLSLPVAEQFYSGDIKLNIHMVDDDDGEGIDSTNSFLVNNSAPEFIGSQFRVQIGNEFGAESVQRGDDVKFWVYYQDADFDTNDATNGLDLQEIWVTYRIYVNDQQSDTVKLTVENGDWEIDSTTGAAVLTLKTNDDNPNIPEANTNRDIKIEIISVSLIDNDAGFYEDSTTFGAYQTSITGINYEIDITEIEQPDFPWTWVIIGLVVVAGSILGVWYYKKYFSYKKYMD